MSAQTISTLAVIIVGIINTLPLIGVLGTEKLSAAYDIAVDSDNLAILMKHRAILFGLIGGFVFFSLWQPQYQSAAMALAGISMVSFFLLMAQHTGYTPAITKIAIGDAIGTTALIIWAGIRMFGQA